MKYKVIVSDRAKEMLAMHLRFMMRVNKSAAKQLKKRMTESIRSLQDMPQKYPFLNEQYIPANKYHKMYVENWYLVLYQIKDEKVYVDWIVDCRQDFQWLIK